MNLKRDITDKIEVSSCFTPTKNRILLAGTFILGIICSWAVTAISHDTMLQNRMNTVFIPWLIMATDCGGINLSRLLLTKVVTMMLILFPAYMQRHQHFWLYIGLSGIFPRCYAACFSGYLLVSALRWRGALILSMLVVPSLLLDIAAFVLLQEESAAVFAEKQAYSWDSQPEIRFIRRRLVLIMIMLLSFLWSGWLGIKLLGIAVAGL